MRVSIDGSIGVGKSTVLKGLADRGYNVQQENVRGWVPWLERVAKAPREGGNAILMQLKILFDLSNHRKERTDEDWVVERSPYTARHVFTQRMFDHDLIRLCDLQLYAEFYNELGWQPDCIIFIHASPRVCLDRIHRRGRSGEQGLTLEILEELDRYHRRLWKQTRDCPVWWVDGSLPPDAVLVRVLSILQYVMPPLPGSSQASSPRPDSVFSDVRETLAGERL